MQHVLKLWLFLFADYDDYLDDDDLDLIEENLGVKVKRRVRIIYYQYFVCGNFHNFSLSRYAWLLSFLCAWKSLSLQCPCCPCLVSQKKKYDRVKTLDDDEEDDDEKDLIADEIFHGDAEGELEEGEAVDEPLRHGDDDEEGEDEESGKIKNF